MNVEQSERAKLYLLNNSKYFPAEKVAMVKSKLETLDENQFMMATSVELKDPTIMLLVSIFVGSLGIDRFMMGDIGMGVLKLITGGVCGILWIIDIIGIQKKAKELNFNTIMLVM